MVPWCPTTHAPDGEGGQGNSDRSASVHSRAPEIVGIEHLLAPRDVPVAAPPLPVVIAVRAIEGAMYVAEGAENYRNDAVVSVGGALTAS